MSFADPGDRYGLEQVGAQLAELTGLLEDGRPGPPTAERVVRFAATAVGRGEDCGLWLIRGSRPPATVAYAGPLSPAVDAIQIETGEGPCLEASEASRASNLVKVDDLGRDERWPEFGRRCLAETGVRSMLSVRLFLSGDDRGALNMYAREPGAFDDLAVGTAAIFAPFATLALRTAAREREIAQLRTALHSSRQIGIAMGILMARQQVTSEKAFAQLVTASQHLNRKLRDIAAEVAETGTLPEVPAKRR
jgi:ANTAR domain-containing protein/GAF domain-containing protein